MIFLEPALETSEHERVMNFRLHQRWPPKIMIWKPYEPLSEVSYRT